MKYLSFLLLALSATVTAVPCQNGQSCGKPIPAPGPDGKYTLTAPGIRAQFIPYGAAITNLFVKDKNGIERDIVVGYDNASYYPTDPNHGHYGAVPGRYANRIGNGTFSVDGATYHLDTNDGPNTLHSGLNGWGFRTFNVVAVSQSSITFSIVDPDMSSNMPGTVYATITYTLSKDKWSIVMDAISPNKKTPLSLTQHTYWNLDAFANPNTDTILDHTYYTPYSKRLLEPDPNTLPTGNILNIPKGNINDFWSAPKKLGSAVNDPAWVGNCGTGSGCAGYNNLWIVDKPPQSKNIAATLASAWSGIKVDIRTNQQGMVLYTCYWSNGASPIKSTQGGAGAATNGFVKSSGCVALEAQEWVDGINHPEWGRKQFYGPGDKYHWEADYTFSTFK